jgi:broad specificity phosphatase PhoE
LKSIRIALVRHGRASAGWDTALDPELDELGRAQAQDAASKLDKIFAGNEVEIISSPLLRCQQTADAFVKLRALPLWICVDVTEIPSPSGLAMADRVVWLREVMQGNWADLGANYLEYRDAIVRFVEKIEQNTVIFSHFIAINAIVGSIIKDDRLVIHKLDNCSITVLEIASDGALRIVQSGHEADTLIR